MARFDPKPIRLPDLGKSEKYGNLSLLSKVLWPMLLVTSDDLGHGSAVPEVVKWGTCPNVGELTPDNIPVVLDDMAEQGLIRFYTDKRGRPCYKVKGWTKAAYRRIVRYPSTEWRRKRLAILERDDWVCQYCGAPATHVDHVMPHSRGGSDCSANLVAACAHCNFHKSDRTPEEAGMTFIAGAGDDAKMAQDSH